MQGFLATQRIKGREREPKLCIIETMDTGPVDKGAHLHKLPHTARTVHAEKPASACRWPLEETGSHRTSAWLIFSASLSLAFYLGSSFYSRWDLCALYPHPMYFFGHPSSIFPYASEKFPRPQHWCCWIIPGCATAGNCPFFLQTVSSTVNIWLKRFKGGRQVELPHFPQVSGWVASAISVFFICSSPPGSVKVFARKTVLQKISNGMKQIISSERQWV